tara:strand:+ start:4518 stop:5132 length:615 start_codon:yes stop_codon:yes gene_type:complete
MIVIVDYGMGNLGSVLKSFNRLKIDVKISKSKNDILNADKLILPGVGHFKKGMENLINLDYIDVLNKKVIIDKTPILGICLGMQLFSNYSEEGNVKGLEWVDSEVLKFKVDNILKWKIPHMGWNTINIKRDNIFLKNIKNEEIFYFVHGYYMNCKDRKDVLSTTKYCNSFVSSINKENIYGAQFHPEKSHDQGIVIINNFVKLI